jgi:hypothetical protein
MRSGDAITVSGDADAWCDSGGCDAKEEANDVGTRPESQTQRAMLQKLVERIPCHRRRVHVSRHRLILVVLLLLALILIIVIIIIILGRWNIVSEPRMMFARPRRSGLRLSRPPCLCPLRLGHSFLLDRRSKHLGFAGGQLGGLATRGLLGGRQGLECARGIEQSGEDGRGGRPSGPSGAAIDEREIGHELFERLLSMLQLFDDDAELTLLVRELRFENLLIDRISELLSRGLVEQVSHGVVLGWQRTERQQGHDALHLRQELRLVLATVTQVRARVRQGRLDLTASNQLHELLLLQRQEQSRVRREQRRGKGIELLQRGVDRAGCETRANGGACGDGGEGHGGCMTGGVTNRCNTTVASE